MRELSLGTIVKAALIAGLAAGLTVAIFHFLATEPVIEHAINLEEQRHEAEGGAESAHEMPLVSRDAQRVGLFIGFLIYGTVWALLFALTFHIVQQRLPASGTVKARLLLAAAGYWAVGLLPGLKYPANPPGVGDPDTIGFRQGLFLGFLVLSIAGTALAFAFGRYLRQGGRSGQQSMLLAVGFLLGFDLLIFLVMPSNPDAIEMPMTLVTSFRMLSMVGLALFWGVFGFFFAKLLPHGEARGSSAAVGARA